MVGTCQHETKKQSSVRPPPPILSLFAGNTMSLLAQNACLEGSGIIYSRGVPLSLSA